VKEVFLLVHLALAPAIGGGEVQKEFPASFKTMAVCERVKEVFITHNLYTNKPMRCVKALR